MNREEERKLMIEMKTGKVKSNVKQLVEVDAVGGVPVSVKRQPKVPVTEATNQNDSARKKPEDPMATFSSAHKIPRLYLSDYLKLEEQVRELANFHGFVCREDLPIMLPKQGDWLIRISIHPEKKKKKSKSKSDKEKQFHGKRQERPKARSSVVITVHAHDNGNVKLSPQKEPMIKNIAINLHSNQYWIGTGPKFLALYQMFDWASNNPVRYKDFEFRLRRQVLLEPWEFRHDDIQLLKTKLGEGAFGEVRSGRILIMKTKTLVNVAVKMLKNAETGVTRDQIHELLHEARMMRVLNHPNVLMMCGVAVTVQPPMLMTELCSLGALREYLRDNKCSLTEKLKFVLGAARGVEYIHSQIMIHRDLAVRNIFLTADKTPKVSDFGLARQTDRYEMKEHCKIPVRYLAPETLENFIFTPKTDVFSFGCVIWEIYENGKQPYDGLNVVSIKTRVKKREYLKLTAEVPMELRKLVADRVFVADPENRCGMTAVVKMCETLLK